MFRSAASFLPEMKTPKTKNYSGQMDARLLNYIQNTGRAPRPDEFDQILYSGPNEPEPPKPPELPPEPFDPTRLYNNGKGPIGPTLPKPYVTQPRRDIPGEYGGIENELGGPATPQVRNYPSREEALTRLPAQQVYLAKLKDYLADKVKKDNETYWLKYGDKLSELKANYETSKAFLDNSLTSGTMNRDDYNNQKNILDRSFNIEQNLINTQNNAAGFLDEKSSQALYNQANEIVTTGVYDKPLPYFNEVKDVYGINTAQLYHKTAGEMQAQTQKEDYAREQARQAALYGTGRTSDYDQRGRNVGRNVQDIAGENIRRNLMPSENAYRQDIYAQNMTYLNTWAENAPLAAVSKKWLRNHAQELYGMWAGSNGMNLANPEVRMAWMPWLSMYLATGGKSYYGG